MSDTITVTTTPPAPAAGYGGGILFVPSTPAVTNQQVLIQVVMPYFSTPKFCVDYANFLVKYMNEHDLNDPLTMQVVLNNIRNMCAADNHLLNNREAGVWAAYNNHPLGEFDYVKNASSQLTGDVTTPITAWAHYLWGNGRERFVNMQDVGFRIQPNQIDPVMKIVNSGAVGTFNISERFNRDTMLDGIIPAAYLGNVTLKTEGTLTIETSGAWNYNGVVRGYNDTYDANPSNYRGPIAEASTVVLNKMKGTEYQIALPGEIAVQGNGFR
ncbi:lipid II-degrading bacteriocin [Serratia sp. 121840015-1]